MTEQPRDWDRELANIDRAIAKQPAATPSPPATGPSAPVAARRFVALTWFWTVLAVILALALPLWPYDQSCGLRLVFYLGAAGIRSGRCPWYHCELVTPAGRRPHVVPISHCMGRNHGGP